MIVELIQPPTSQTACQEGGQLNSVRAAKHPPCDWKTKAHVTCGFTSGRRDRPPRRGDAAHRILAGKHCAESSMPTPKGEDNELIVSTITAADGTGIYYKDWGTGPVSREEVGDARQGCEGKIRFQRATRRHSYTSRSIQCGSALF
jgi:hypothetical protein